MAELARLSATVRGRVQGVLFRAFVSDHATALGLTGYARNMPDGTVEVEAEGERAWLEQLLEHLRRGPRKARVDGVDAAWSQGQGRFSRFETR